MLSEAQQFWDAIKGKVRQLIRSETENTYRCERYEVTTAPNGTKVGVTLPAGNNEIFLPYSAEVAGAAVGDPVMAVWWKSMSNAKVCWFADGYRGISIINQVYPVGSLYMSTSPTSPASLFGGVWTLVKDRFILGAGDTYSVWEIGGEATHTLTSTEMPSHYHDAFQIYDGTIASPTLNANTSAPQKTGSYSMLSPYVHGTADANYDKNAWLAHSQPSGGSGAHNTMPPYLVVYIWRRQG